MPVEAIIAIGLVVLIGGPVLGSFVLGRARRDRVMRGPDV